MTKLFLVSFTMGLINRRNFNRANIGFFLVRRIKNMNLIYFLIIDIDTMGIVRDVCM